MEDALGHLDFEKQDGMEALNIFYITNGTARGHCRDSDELQMI